MQIARPVALAVSVLCLAAQTTTYRTGDRVEAYDAGWNKGAVTEIGSGNYQGYYLVKYDAFSTSRWFHPRDLRPGGPPDAPKVYPTYKTGEKVEGYDFGWYSGTIVETRAGKDSTEYLIRYDKFNSSRWYHPRDMRAAGAGEAEKAQNAAAAAQGPRLGKYGIRSYGATGAPPLYLGHVELMAGNRYRISRTSGEPYYGDGEYRFNAAAGTIEWRSGPLAGSEWSGKFSVDGATHRIGLRTRTIATSTPQ